MVAVAPRKVVIRGGVWREFFVPLTEGMRRQKAIESELGRPLNYYDDDEYERAADCYQFPKARRKIVNDHGEEWIEAPIPYLTEGRVGTGKTFSIATFLHLLAENFPGIRILVIRQTFESLTDSFKATFEDDVLPPEHEFLNERAMTRGHRKEYVYKNDARIVMRGFDRPGRTLSTEWDVIYFMEVTDEGVELSNVEQLGRGLRGNRCPFKLFLMDCNPGNEMHWANQGCLDGRFRRIVTTWRDNPAFWDAALGRFKRKGLDYTSQVKAIYTGPNYDRYVLGLWKTAQGAIFPAFDMSRNVVDLRAVQDERTKKWRVLLPTSHPLAPSVEVDFFAGAIDFGFNAPGTLQVWAIDSMRRMYLIEEVYRTQQTIEWWSEIALKAHKRYDLDTLVCDSEDPSSIRAFNQRFGYQRGRSSDIAVGVSKSKDRGMSFWRASVNLTNSLFQPAPRVHPSEREDLAPRIMISSHALVEGRDTSLGYAPSCLVQEIPGYVYRTQKPGEQPHEEPANVPDHGCDTMRYMAWWLHRNFTVRRARPRLAPPGSIGEIMGGFEIFEQ